MPYLSFFGMSLALSLAYFFVHRVDQSFLRVSFLRYLTNQYQWDILYSDLLLLHRSEVYLYFLEYHPRFWLGTFYYAFRLIYLKLSLLSFHLTCQTSLFQSFCVFQRKVKDPIQAR